MSVLYTGKKIHFGLFPWVAWVQHGSAFKDMCMEGLKPQDIFLPVIVTALGMLNLTASILPLEQGKDLTFYLAFRGSLSEESMPLCI